MQLKASAPEACCSTRWQLDPSSSRSNHFPFGHFSILSVTPSFPDIPQAISLLSLLLISGLFPPLEQLSSAGLISQCNQRCCGPRVNSPGSQTSLPLFCILAGITIENFQQSSWPNHTLNSDALECTSSLSEISLPRTYAPPISSTAPRFSHRNLLLLSVLQPSRSPVSPVGSYP